MLPAMSTNELKARPNIIKTYIIRECLRLIQIWEILEKNSGT